MFLVDFAVWSQQGATLKSCSHNIMLRYYNIPTMHLHNSKSLDQIYFWIKTPEYFDTSCSHKQELSSPYIIGSYSISFEDGDLTLFGPNN